MNKKLLRMGTGLMLAASVLIAGCSSSSEEETAEGKAVLTLRGSTFIPAEHGSFDQINPWIEQVEKETDGEVKFEVFTSGELVKSGKSYDALKSGITDVELSFLAAYEPQRFPLTEVTTLPLLKSDVSVATAAFKKLIESDVEIEDGKTYYELEFASEGLKAFPTVTTEPYVISTTGKSFESVKDFSKVSLRSAARTHEFLIKNLGANSITLPSTDLYDSLSRNALDGTIQSVADWTGYGLQELLKFTLDGINLGHYAPVIAMSEDKFNSLPDNAKQAMENATVDSVQNGIDGWKTRADDARSQYEANGGKFVRLEELDPAVQEHVHKAIEKTWFDWIEAVEKEGNPGKEIAKLWRDLIIEEGGEVPERVKDL